MSPITCSTIRFRSISRAAFSSVNCASTSARASLSILTPFISISHRNRSISFINGMTFFRLRLCSRAKMSCCAIYNSPQALTSASAYSTTTSRGISEKHVPPLNSSSTKSDFFKLSVLRRRALSFRLSSLRWPLANRYSVIIVSLTIGGNSKPISSSHSASNFTLWHIMPSASARCCFRRSIPSGECSSL